MQANLLKIDPLLSTLSPPLNSLTFAKIHGVTSFPFFEMPFSMDSRTACSTAFCMDFDRSSYSSGIGTPIRVPVFVCNWREKSVEENHQSRPPVYEGKSNLQMSSAASRAVRTLKGDLKPDLLE